MVRTEGENILEFLHALDVLKNATSKCKLTLLNNLISLGNIGPSPLVFWSYRQKITYAMYYKHRGLHWQRTEDQAFISHCTYLGFPQVLRTWGGGSSKFDEGWGGRGGLSQYMGGSMGGALNAVKKNLWRSSFDSKVAGYKPASLQIY